MQQPLRPHPVFACSVATDRAMRGLALQLSAHLVAFPDLAGDMIVQALTLVGLDEGAPGGASAILPETAELYGAMAGVPLRERRRILECLHILHVWHETAIVDVTRAQSVAIYAGADWPGLAPEVTQRPALSLVRNG